MLCKTLTTLIISFTLAFSCYCQGDGPCIAERGKKGTQGENEDQGARKLIRHEYSKNDYVIYPGEITVLNHDTVKYNAEILIVTNTCNDLKLVFQKGILYPGIINGDINMHRGIITKHELDSLALAAKTECLKITDFKELTFIKHSTGTRFFRFWLFSPGRANPAVCFVALYNKTANRKTDLHTFINGARLTFFRKGWVII
jgi:hypothetical protein